MYLKEGFFKKYKKFEWKKAFGLIPYPSWTPVVEDYKDNIHAGVVIDKIPKSENGFRISACGYKEIREGAAKDCRVCRIFNIRTGICADIL